MAIFKKQLVPMICSLCGRQDEVVLVLFSSKPLATRQRVTDRLKMCGRCGQLIHLVATTENIDYDRDRHHERQRPRKARPKVR